MSTPIESLNRPMPQMQQLPQNDGTAQVLDYSEILRNIHDDQQPMQIQQQNQQMPQMQQMQQMQQMPQMQTQPSNFPPPPMMQSMKPQGYVMQPMPNPNNQQPNQESKLGDVQKDILIILVLCVIVYSDHFQMFIQRMLPSLFKGDNKLSAIGTITFACIIAGSYFLTKNVSINI